MVAPLAALNRAADYDLAGNFNNLSTGDHTYMLLAPSRDRIWLQSAIDGIFERHYPDLDQEFVVGMRVRPLREVNTYIWDAVGLPVLDSVRLLALLVLVVAIVNYTNLASAQSLGRSREIGMRKTMGASRRQLVGQFLTESICVTALALVLSIVAIYAFIPLFNNASDKAVSFELIASAPWLLTTLIADWHRRRRLSSLSHHPNHAYRGTPRRRRQLREGQRVSNRHADSPVRHLRVHARHGGGGLPAE